MAGSNNEDTDRADLSRNIDAPVRLADRLHPPGTAGAMLFSGTNTVPFFVAPNGNDVNDGGARERPIATIGHAQDLVSALVSGGVRTDVEMIFLAGDYSNQHVNWTRTILGHRITFKVKDDANAMPRFDGRGLRAETFFAFTPDDRTGTIRLEKLRIEDYTASIGFAHADHNEVYVQDEAIMEVVERLMYGRTTPTGVVEDDGEFSWLVVEDGRIERHAPADPSHTAVTSSSWAEASTASSPQNPRTGPRQPDTLAVKEAS